MTIAKKLRLMALLSMTTALVFILFFVLAYRMRSDAHREMRAVDEVMEATAEINILSSRYMVRPEKRVRARWMQADSRLVNGLKKAPVKGSESRAVVDRMIRNLAGIRVAFSDLAATPRKGGPAWARSADALVLSAGKLTRDASLLIEASEERIGELNRRIVVALIVFSILLAAVVFRFSTAVAGSISGPLDKLREGTEIIGSGNLDYRIGMGSQDEIGLLSDSFDRMAAGLKEITVSRDELAGEIARRKQVQAELERSNRELEQFAYVASHDLQEPLRNVAGFVQLLGKKYKGNLDERADKYIHFAADGALRMQKLIDGLLAYSRVSTKGGEFRQVDLDRVFHEATTNLSASIRENSARVTGDRLPAVIGDETQLLQLLQNLIGNAVKFRKPGVPPEVHVAARTKENEWLFEVRDNGIGIGKQDAGRVFQVFQRLHTQEEYPGTGIGLAVCKKIVERHGGRIWVESVPGEGASFFFTLPLGKER